MYILVTSNFQLLTPVGAVPLYLPITSPPRQRTLPRTSMVSGSDSEVSDVSQVS